MKMDVFQSFLNSKKIYHPENVNEVIDLVKPHIKTVNSKKGNYIDGAFSFDIETSSFYSNGEKSACMYIWMLGIYGFVIVGREWIEFEKTIEKLCESFNVSAEKRRIAIYVHNLSYEFQFIRKRFDWLDVFSVELRKPIKALTSTGIEFRCSLALSGYPLSKIGEMVREEFEVEKKTGFLDYKLKRHSKTPLSEKEIDYCSNDVKVVMAYIALKLEEDGDITKIPMTKTGYIRRLCRKNCYHPDEGKNGYARREFISLIRRLTIDSPNEYLQLKRAFQGGFTHSNVFNTNKCLANVTSFDFTSSYPAVMICEKFPMSKAERVEINSLEELKKNFALYCSIFDVEITGLTLKIWNEAPISLSRCWHVSKPVVNNGRLIQADFLKTTLTDVDFQIIEMYYDWRSIKIGNVRRYKKDYLPTQLIKTILSLYQKKTKLKNVTGRELEYMNSKEMLNSCYGMTVTDIMRDEIIYDGDWRDPIPPDISLKLEEYNTDANRFLFYPWGVWIAAYARRNLFSGIKSFNDDYIYSDTDSIKVLNADKHIEYIKGYNRIINVLVSKALDHHGINSDLAKPKTISGIEKPLGNWDFDGHYEFFKTLGAKRYIARFSKDDRNGTKKKSLLLTVSGVNKKIAGDYVEKLKNDKDILEFFNNEMTIPAEFTGKLTHTYIDDEQTGVLIDYLGFPGKWRELSSVHLEECDYTMSLSKEYSDYIAGVQYMGRS